VRNRANVGWDKLTTAGKEFFQVGYDSLKQAISDESIRKMEAMARSFRHSWDLDEVRPLTDLGALQQAKPIMRRWLMADPVIRTRYQQQTIDGYTDKYKDWSVGDIGETHRDYRLAVDGLMLDSNGEGVCTTYLDCEDGVDEDNLSFLSQVDIQRSWAAQRAIIEKGIHDPTSPLNDLL